MLSCPKVANTHLINDHIQFNPPAVKQLGQLGCTHAAPHLNQRAGISFVYALCAAFAHPHNACTGEVCTGAMTPLPPLITVDAPCILEYHTMPHYPPVPPRTIPHPKNPMPPHPQAPHTSLCHPIPLLLHMPYQAPQLWPHLLIVAKSDQDGPLWHPSL